MLPDMHKQDWKDERDDVNAIHGILAGLVVAMMIWGIVIAGLLKSGML